MYRCTPFCLEPQEPQGPRGTLLVITSSYHPNLSRSPGAPRVPGTLHWGFLCSPGEPYSSSLVRITPTCLDPPGPLGFQGPYTGCFFVPLGPLGPRGERPGPCHREAQRFLVFYWLRTPFTLCFPRCVMLLFFLFFLFILLSRSIFAILISHRAWWFPMHGSFDSDAWIT